MNRVHISYFDDAEALAAWRTASGLDEFLLSDEHLSGDYGIWAATYVFEPGQFETLFSTLDNPEGLAHMADGTVGSVREHGYWGGAEDRIPNATGDNFNTPLNAMPAQVAEETRGKHLTVRGPGNLCLIRSGQDLREIKGAEKDEYETMIEPSLRDGLKYLADHPDTGCFDSRYMQLCSPHREPEARTFGMQIFLSIQHLMDWAKSHPTHLKILSRFQAMAMRLEGQIDIRLWHEVAVTKSGGMVGEYINCNPATGLLPYAEALR